MRIFVLALTCFLVSPNIVQAHRHHHYHSKHVVKQLERRTQRLIAYNPIYSEDAPNFVSAFPRPIKHGSGHLTKHGREVVGHKPSGCPHAWCGCWLSKYLGINKRSLWLARNWERFGHRAFGPAAHTIAVWAHHVGLIEAVAGRKILLLSGNDSHAVRERWRSTSGVIAYRSY